ncbi:thiamine phosphate synthase [Nocardioides humilatus]|uniref:Thiamine-phosphate synthase n=1 Tax=Nocardioides humilatus TaxID=2607660 RepID=A0A5B1LKU5_9ACTN|nr:thiamine phosphate synthase [Nocardioides humilatus]KAA1421351.1 thiamine phosphate synthase [Nocardioides humilatus]
MGRVDHLDRVPRLTCLVSERDDLTLLPALAEVGVDGFQVRAKTYGGRALCALTERVLGAVAFTDARVLVNDRLDVALAVGADGVHLGASDLPVAEARRVAPDLLIGATCRSRAEVLRAAGDGADYAGFGPVFATTSKAGVPSPLGPEALTPAVGVIPLVAIGGIDAARVAAVVAAGAFGVAVIGGIWRHPDPVGAAKELVAAIGG